MADLTALYDIKPVDQPVQGPDVLRAEGGPIAVTVELQPGETGRLFKRRAVKAAGSPAAKPVGAMVAELDGVRLYLLFDVGGAQVLLTRRDVQL